MGEKKTADLRLRVARPRRVVAQVKWHPGKLFPDTNFVVTNLTAPPRAVVRFYNRRGTAEQWIKKGKYALHWTRLSCHRFVANQVRLARFVLAYNLGNFLRRLALPESIQHWSLRSIQVKLIKTGAKVIHHARHIIFQMAEGAICADTAANLGPSARRRAEEINALEPEIKALSDEALRGKADEFRDRLADGETLDDILNEAFAVVRGYIPGPTEWQVASATVLHWTAIHRLDTGLQWAGCRGTVGQAFWAKCIQYSFG